MDSNYLQQQQSDIFELKQSFMDLFKKVEQLEKKYQQQPKVSASISNLNQNEIDRCINLLYEDCLKNSPKLSFEDLVSYRKVNCNGGKSSEHKSSTPLSSQKVYQQQQEEQFKQKKKEANLKKYFTPELKNNGHYSIHNLGGKGVNLSYGGNDKPNGLMIETDDDNVLNANDVKLEQMSFAHCRNLWERRSLDSQRVKNFKRKFK